MSKTFSHPSFCLLNKSKLFFWWRDRKRNNSEFLKKRRFCLVSHEFSLLFSVISNSNFTKLHQIVIKRCVKEKNSELACVFQNNPQSQTLMWQVGLILLNKTKLVLIDANTHVHELQKKKQKEVQNPGFVKFHLENQHGFSLTYGNKE